MSFAIPRQSVMFMQLESNSGEYSTTSYITRVDAPSTGGKIRFDSSLFLLCPT